MTYEEKTLESDIVYKGKIFDIRRDKILAVNDKISYRDIVVHGGAAVLIPITEDGKIENLKEFMCKLNNYDPYEKSDIPEFIYT